MGVIQVEVADSALPSRETRGNALARTTKLSAWYTMAAFPFCALEIDMLGALAALLLFQCLGEGVSYVFHLPVPGPVIGMLLLFGFIMMRPQTADAIEPTALELLRHLSLLFVPAGVGIMVSASRIRGDAVAVIVSIAVSTTLAIAVAALVTRALMRRQQRRQPHDRADTEAAQ